MIRRRVSISLLLAACLMGPPGSFGQDHTCSRALVKLANTEEPLESAFYTAAPDLQVLKQWSPEHFSDPSKHSTKNFRYIYHEVLAAAGNKTRNGIKHSPLFTSEGVSKESYSVRLLAKPGDIAQNPKISASV